MCQDRDALKKMANQNCSQTPSLGPWIMCVWVGGWGWGGILKLSVLWTFMRQNSMKSLTEFHLVVFLSALHQVKELLEETTDFRCPFTTENNGFSNKRYMSRN